jgi:hypothetical protein
MHMTFKNQKEIQFGKIQSKPRRQIKLWNDKRLSQLYQRIKLTQDWFQSLTSELTNEQWA